MDETPISGPSAGQPAKRLGRRATLKLIGLAVTGAATLRPPEAEAAGGQRRVAPDRTATAARRGRAWSLRPLASQTSPRHLDPAEFTSLAAVVDVILPDTDTPGARTAGVHAYLDDVSGTDRALALRLRDGLRRLNARARVLHGRGFANLTAAQQTTLLSAYDEPPAGAEVKVDHAAQPRVTGASPETEAITPDDRGFFAFIKAQTIDAYYKSEMGQIGELEWVGHEFNDTFPGVCSHPDPTAHPRPRWPRSRA